MKQIDGSISIAKASGMDGDFMTIRVEDTDSGIQFAEIRLSMLDYAQLITGRSNVKGDLYVRRLKDVGRISENKKEIIEITYPSGKQYGDGRKKFIKQALVKHEVDGWKGDWTDAKNSHRIISYTTNEATNEEIVQAEVSFQRFVDRPEE